MSVASKRPFVAIVTAAAESYLADPSYYKPHIKPEKLPVSINVQVGNGISDFFLNEAFVAPVSYRAHLLGLVVGLFLRRYPFEDLVTALHAYADILGPMLRRIHDRKNERTEVPKDY